MGRRRSGERPEIPIQPIVEYYGGDVHSARGGTWKKMACFLHPDNTPSATINFELNRYYCFSCGVSEDTVGLVMLQDGLNFLDALRKAESLAGTSRTPVRGSSRQSVFDEPW